MRTNKIIHKISAIAILLVSFSSCEKALEEKPFSFLSPNNFYQNEADAVTAINGVYSSLYTYDLYLQPMWNLTALDDDHTTGVDWFLGTSGAGNPQGYWGVDGPWVGCYSMIARASTVIENVAKIESNIDPVMRNRVIGEAHCLRGWAYFQLVQLYGGVPLRLSSLSADPVANVPRAAVKDVYAAIIEELKLAETLLLPKSDPKSGDPGRVNQTIAKGLLAKVYATMASGSLSGATIDIRGGQDNGYYTYTKGVVSGLEGLDTKAYYQLAKDKAQEVISSTDYKLTNNWVATWSKANRNTNEQMWMVQSLAGSEFVTDIHNYFSAISTFGRGAVWASNNHYLDYEEQDQRVLNGVSHNFTINSGGRYYYPSWEAAKYQTVNGLTYNNNGGTDNRAYVIKFADVTDPSVSRSDAQYPLLRLADVVLIYAEAANEIAAAPTADAYEKLNMIRTRVNATAAPAGMTTAAFRSYVLAERAREFALEGVRRFDLQRWGVYLEVMNKISAGQNNISKVRSNRNLLLPIPLGELNSNQAIKGNNPGW